MHPLSRLALRLAQLADRGNDLLSAMEFVLAVPANTVALYVLVLKGPCLSRTWGMGQPFLFPPQLYCAQYAPRERNSRPLARRARCLSQRCRLAALHTTAVVAGRPQTSLRGSRQRAAVMFGSLDRQRLCGCGCRRTNTARSCLLCLGLSAPGHTSLGSGLAALRSRPGKHLPRCSTVATAVDAECFLALAGCVSAWAFSTGAANYPSGAFSPSARSRARQLALPLTQGAKTRRARLPSRNWPQSRNRARTTPRRARLRPEQASAIAATDRWHRGLETCSSASALRASLLSPDKGRCSSNSSGYAPAVRACRHPNQAPWLAPDFLRSARQSKRRHPALVRMSGDNEAIVGLASSSHTATRCKSCCGIALGDATLPNRAASHQHDRDFRRGLLEAQDPMIFAHRLTLPSDCFTSRVPVPASAGRLIPVSLWQSMENHGLGLSQHHPSPGHSPTAPGSCARGSHLLGARFACLRFRRVRTITEYLR
ncbi:hypothetical protein BCR34DRAFT_651347 [Clohesyomyces aquaticus]|uniref:Uncharacterized protein n=1 Tax=Clohesyomyces aquaticus TaxID=1231657 RepID=A0A1Y1ZPZ2_9PLEO|nr:hypothetical protein BCR34DRAFT_651347 [Clohesyomyces aquaticus]